MLGARTHRGWRAAFALCVFVLATSWPTPAGAVPKPVVRPLSATSSEAPIVGAASSASGLGYWVAAADGRVWPYGDAPHFGDVHNKPLVAPIVGIAATPDHGGYWLVSADGGIFTFGNARFRGSIGGKILMQPITGMTSTPSGRGYWMVARDGGVFTFGDAHFYGAAVGRPHRGSIIGMATSASGRGYTLLAEDGHAFFFGDAVRRASATGLLHAAGSGITRTPDGRGYWIVSGEGAVYGFGAAPYHGGIGSDGRARGVVGLVSTPDGAGYWLVTNRGAVLPYGSADWYGSVTRSHRPVLGPPRIRIFGDSLVTQSTPQLVWQGAINGMIVEHRDYIGTVLCDWVPEMLDRSNVRADVVVLAFSGNARRPCMPPDSTNHVDRFDKGYRRAALQALAAFGAEGTEVVFALPPPRLDIAAAATLPDLYRSIAVEFPTIARTYDAGALVSAPGRRWTSTLPCLPFETAAWGCHNGRIAVRSADRVHFCPGAMNPGSLWAGCSVWSSGAWRYADGLIAAGRRGLR
jgi:hypothetical protein